MNRTIGIVLALVGLIALVIVGVLAVSMDGDGGSPTPAQSSEELARIADEQIAADELAARERAAATKRVPRGAGADEGPTTSEFGVIRGVVKMRAGAPMEGVEVLVFAAPEGAGLDARTRALTRLSATESGRKLQERLGDERGAEIAEAAEDGNLEPAMREGLQAGMELLREGALELDDIAEMMSGLGALSEALPTADPVGTAITDAAGAFRVEGLRNKETFEVRVDVPGHMTVRRFVQPGGAALDVVLQAGGQISGRVLSGGEVLAGAQVRLTNKILVTAADGSFTTDTANIPEETLLVTAPGYVAAARRVDVASGRANEIEIVLAPGGAVTGSVRDAGGAPLSGARVAVKDNAVNPMMFMGGMQRGAGEVAAPNPSAVTDANGAYRLDGVAAGTIDLEASAGGHLKLRKTGITLAAGETLQGIDFILAGESRVTGRVTDSAGKPLSGATVRVERPAAEGGMNALMRQFTGGSFSTTRTGGDGRFELGGLAAGERKVEIDCEGYLKHTGKVSIPVGAEATYDAALDGGLGLGGIVLDPDGKPLVGATVGIDWPVEGDGNPMAAMVAAMGGGGAADKSVTTGDEGRWTATGLQVGPYTVTAKAHGFLDGKVEGVEAGTQDVELMVRLAATFRGRVVAQETGQPVAEAKVFYKGGPPRRGNPMMAWMSQDEHVVSGQDGTFEIAGVEGGKWEFWARAIPFAEGLRSEHTCDPGQVVESIVLQLPRGATLEGHVVDLTSGAPLAEATVFVSLATGPMAAMMEDSPFGANMGERISVTTDASGAFLLEGLTPGKLNINARFEGRAPVKVSGYEVPGTPLQIKMGSGGWVSGNVTDAAGNPTSGATLTLLKGMMAPMGTTASDASGFYEFELIPPGTYTVMLMDPSSPMGMGGMASVTVKEGVRTEHDFSTKKQGRSFGGSVIRDGQPLANQPVMLMGGPGGLNTAMTDAQGRFEFSGLEPGTYQVMVQDSMMGGGSTSQEVVVGQDGNMPDVRLEFSNLQLAGRVVDAQTGSGIALAQVILLEPGGGTSTSLADFAGRQRGQSFTDETGKFVMRGVAAGSFQLRVTAEGYAAAMIEGVSAGTTQAIVKMTPGLELVVRVVDPQGRPVTGANVTHVDSQGRESFAFDMTMSGRTDTSGVARLRLQPGPYELRVEADGYPLATRRTEATAGEVKIQLEAGGKVSITVLDAADAAVAGAKVTLHDATGKSLARGLSLTNMLSPTDQTDGAGLWVLDGVAPGTLTATIVYDGRTRTVELSVAAGAETKATVRLD